MTKRKIDDMPPLELPVSSFISLDAWDACIDKSITPVGVDASVKHGTAIIAVSWDQNRSRATFIDPATGKAP